MRDGGRGFTLIELLVAITILAIVAVLGWRGLDSIVRARATLTTDMEQTRGMQLAFAQLQSDCAHIASTAAIPNREPVVVSQDRLLLVRTVFADDQPTRLQVIVYRLTGGALTRRESAATRDLGELDTMWQAAMGDKDTGTPVLLQSGLSSMGLRTWVRNGKAWGERAAAATPTVLSGLEVSLQLQEHGGRMTKVFLLGPV